MRPHVELIDQKDLIWHPAEFVHATGEARQKHLAYDEEDASLSAIVHFDTEWTRPRGVHSAETEWFVLSGEVRIGPAGPDQEVLREGGYWQAPIGVVTPELSVAADTEILFFHEYGDWSFELRATRPR